MIDPPNHTFFFLYLLIKNEVGGLGEAYKVLFRRVLFLCNFRANFPVLRYRVEGEREREFRAKGQVFSLSHASRTLEKY